MNFLKRHQWLLAILVLGTVIRLAWVYFVNTQPIYDFKHYHDLAMSLLRHGTYTMPEGLDYIKSSTDYIKAGEHHPTAFRPPGYPFFLVALYKIYPSILMAKLANVVLGIVWMLCIYLLGAKFFGKRVGLGAAFVTAIFPPAVYYTSVVGTEILSVALLLLILCVMTFRVGGRWGTHLLSGALIGFLTLVKPYFEVFPLLYIIVLWWLRRSAQQESIGVAAFVRQSAATFIGAFVSVVLVMLVVISPWTVRNYKALDRFVLISTNGNLVLYQNNNDKSTGTTMDPMLVPNSIFKTDRIVSKDGTYNEADAMKAAKQEAVKWIVSHKAQYLVLGMKRLAASYFTIGIEMWAWTMSTAELRFNEYWIDPLMLGARAFAYVVAGSGLMYTLFILYQFVRRRPLNTLHLINLLFIGFFTAIMYATEGQPRYMVPTYPFFILGFCWMMDRLAQGMLRHDRDFCAYRNDVNDR